LIKKGRADGFINPHYNDETILSICHIYNEGLKIFSDTQTNSLPDRRFDLDFLEWLEIVAQLEF
jgi:hypothetical protein